MTRAALWFGALGMVALAGCGGMSKADIAAGWGATNGVLVAGSSSVSQALSDDTVSAGFGYSCPEGGSAEFATEATLSGDENAGTMEFGFVVTFSACQAQGVQIDGTLDYNGAGQTDTDSLTYSYSYAGTLTWSGDVEGECVIDLAGTLDLGGSSTAMSFEGSICGEDASAVFALDS